MTSALNAKARQINVVPSFDIIDRKFGIYLLPVMLKVIFKHLIVNG